MLFEKGLFDFKVLLETENNTIIRMKRRSVPAGLILGCEGVIDFQDGGVKRIRIDNVQSKGTWFHISCAFLLFGAGADIGDQEWITMKERQANASLAAS
jgi:hypothetical protein